MDGNTSLPSERSLMAWSDGVAYFFGGVFLANFTPHFIAGVSGRRFYSPFAKPPFRGLSSPSVNILWGLCNLLLAYALLMLVGSFEPRRIGHFALVVSGFGLAALGIAGSLGRRQRHEAELTRENPAP
jgi:hypothetical protein